MSEEDLKLTLTGLWNRWLGSACMDCEICAVDYTACPLQKNPGRVSKPSFVCGIVLFA